ncbi:MAG: class I SAM-dependent methyltransferase [Bacteroidales bacterium]|nr:class I SAM-dependent methyltransferase [Bacteroidales bacterium]
MQNIKPIAMPGTHEKFLEFFIKESHPQSYKILDLGAGHGAFTQKLFNLGYDMSACDLFPEAYEFDKVPCVKADITTNLPFSDNYFDMVIAIEVSEHVLDHEKFFAEVNRILKKGGKFYISTPNILSMKSRMKFLMGGFFHSFGKLDLNKYDGLQHVASISLDQYNYIAVKNGFDKARVEIDRKQSSSQWLYVILFPLLVFNKTSFHNQKKLLLGRLLFLTFIKL